MNFSQNTTEYLDWAIKTDDSLFLISLPVHSRNTGYLIVNGSILLRNLSSANKEVIFVKRLLNWLFTVFLKHYR